MIAAWWTWSHWIAAWRATEASVWLVLVLTAAPYIWGLSRLWRRAGRGRGISGWRAVSYGTGVAVLALALASPLDLMADGIFAAHMTQHLLLIAAVPPLLIAGNPLIAFAWLGRIARWQRGVHAVQRVGRTFTAPIVALLANTAALWAWHSPALYQLALRRPAVHAAEHASLLITALLVWYSAMRPQGRRRDGYAMGMLLMFATAMQSGALGALLVTARAPWYHAGSTAAATLGLTPLADQQLAGLIMWIPGGAIYTLAACALFFAWFARTPVTLAATLELQQ
ncbi:MAG TPA: cytochrome c oxidase assembly protein [Gemmatimonadales bacterium]|jgi:putative membrane protein|nr:cytochrome c oxidase assembly protein [Gemmatimonadales bacterium]